jgi:hypothetical protein
VAVTMAATSEGCDQRALITERYAMTEHSHAEHRWPIDEDPAQAWRAAPTMLDRFYPMDDLVAVIDDRATAERAVQALKDAGVSDGDVDLVDGAWFAQAARSAVGQRGWVKRLTHLLPTDETYLAKTYVEEAEHQHNLVVVHAPSQDDVERARKVLAAHGGREMHHYGQNVIRDL